MDSSRLQIRYAEDGGKAKDGVIELRVMLMISLVILLKVLGSNTEPDGKQVSGKVWRILRHAHADVIQYKQKLAP